MRYGFVIDQNRCIGCHACTVACKDEHEVPIGVNRTWVKYIEKGVFPATRRHFAVLRCNHCDDAPCVEICPTIALYRSPNGIVDFDNERCIGCKSCMQACPYDAIYIDPNQNTAAKCNFCAHRVELGLQPACEVVCPTQAIVSGDMDEPTSKVSRMIAMEKVSVRKPHKGTNPKLFYVGVEEAALQPVMTQTEDTHFWADKYPGEDLYALAEAKYKGPIPGRAREVYDAPHPRPWGEKIAAYLWTKSIGAGVLMVAAVLLMMGQGENSALVNIWSPIVALIFTGLTTGLLIVDLKRPDRFYYLLTKPNLKSWLVLGGYILMAYSGLALLWLVFGAGTGQIPTAILLLSGILGIGSAGYSAFLFAQAKGRDLWQSPLFLWHLIVQAFA
ncbi:MAG: 4Fe-4S dicluster domain-containing protein, partial [Planctomycetota bacterium]